MLYSRRLAVKAKPLDFARLLWELQQAGSQAVGSWPVETTSIVGTWLGEQEVMSPGSGCLDPLG